MFFVLIVSGISFSDTINLFSLRDAVTVGIKNNPIEVPLIRVNHTIAK